MSINASEIITLTGRYCASCCTMFKKLTGEAAMGFAALFFSGLIAYILIMFIFDLLN